MKTITIIGLDGCPASSIAKSLELLSLARDIDEYTRIQNSPHVRLATLEGKYLTCKSNIKIGADFSITEIEYTDAVLIPSLGDNPKHLMHETGAICAWLVKQYAQGAAIYTVGSGAFLLAKSGILNGKTAVTSSHLIDQFTTLHPQVSLRTDQPVAHDQGCYSAVGHDAEHQLLLSIVKYLFGPAASRRFSSQRKHGPSQSIASNHLGNQEEHADSIIAAVQELLEKNFHAEISMKDLAERFCMSTRTLNRRFKKVTGENPLEYLQRVRVHAAASQLSNPYSRIAEIARKVGYGDVDFFRSLFKRYFGITPNQYRKQDYDSLPTLSYNTP